MHILVIGASGRVGSTLTEKLLQANHTVVGTTRREEPVFELPNYSQIQLDLSADQASITRKIPDNLDAVYFTSGSGGENLLQVDLHGAIKTMKAAEEKGVSKYIMLSTIFATQPEKWQDVLPENMYDYYVAKLYADEWLKNQTSLDYTILQPGALKEEDGHGTISTQVEEPGENPIEDVAQTLMEVLQNPNASKKVITMHSGKKPIPEAIGAL